MSTPGFNRQDFDQMCRDAYAVWIKQDKNYSKAAESLGMDRCTFVNRVKKAISRNLVETYDVEVPAGMEVTEFTERTDKHGNPAGSTVKMKPGASDEPFEVPDGHRVKGISALADENGNVYKQWIKTEREKGTDQEAVIESIKLAAEEAVERKVAERAAADMAIVSKHLAADANPDLLNLHPLADMHLGLYVWGQHAGVAWDLKTAIAFYREVMAELMRRAPAAQRGVILGGGDILHADDETKKTRRSGHVLDVDSRYEKVLMEAELLMVHQVELALNKYPEVVVRILPGNHDDDSSVAVAHFLLAWFRNEPRVEIQVGPGPFFYHDWGNVMISGVHGHETKIEQMPGVMAADQPEMWGRTKFRHAHGFHFHSKKTGDETGGADWEVHRTLIPRDAYAFDNGYRAGRSIQVISYDKTVGEEGRTIINV